MAKDQFNLRVEPGLVRKLDAWLEDLNRDRLFKLKRSDLVRVFLEWGADTRPDFEGAARKREPSADDDAEEDPAPSDPDPDVAQEISKADVERLAAERGTLAPHQIQRAEERAVAEPSPSEPPPSSEPRWIPHKFVRVPRNDSKRCSVCEAWEHGDAALRSCIPRAPAGTRIVEPTPEEQARNAKHGAGHPAQGLSR